jgi:hypothetical protein
MEVKDTGGDARFSEFLQAVERADLSSGDLRVTAHSSAVAPSDWSKIQTAMTDERSR